MNRLIAIVIHILALLSLPASMALADTCLDSIRTRLLNAPVQEKVYLHFDNTCYFKGDTIWYKSYVVKASDHTYTDLSRMLYVELVSPDGLVVERQMQIVSPDGLGDGCFALEDSLYSGFYEVRAYTRWMMNFCVTHRQYSTLQRDHFYNHDLANDFFREYGTVYSRVLPVYERPSQPGEYGMKYIVGRQKTRLDREQKPQLNVCFYPEGGHLIAGQRCVVAFEATDEHGQNVDVDGHILVDGKSLPIRTTHQGRGRFVVDVPMSDRLAATFTYDGRKYEFTLPKADRKGCVLTVSQTDTSIVTDITLTDVPLDSQYALAVMCRGVLKAFETINLFPGTDHARLEIGKDSLATGVCNVLVIDSHGNPLADRLVFVNRHDLGMQRVSMSSAKRKYEPFEEVTLSFQAPADTRHISIAVRDGMTDETTFDTGNMLTDFLLSSELKGFVANADYYFAADDDEHRSALDLLMMVQGWRRYDYEEIVRTRTLRYAPELTLTVEGKVYKMRHFDEITIDDASLLKSAPSAENAKSIYSARAEAGGNTETVFLEPNNPDPYFGANNSDLRHEVTVSGELVCGKRIAEVELETDNHGHFLINVPPFYGDGILFLSAFDSNASDKKLHRLATHQTHNEKEAPAYYVRRDLFYPVFAKPYSFYQCHFPDDDPDTASAIADSTDIEVDRISTMDTQLENVNVDQKRRRGRVRIDYTKPACVYDAVELYNLATDYGLSHGMVNFRRLPMQLAILLFGNYNNHSTLNVQAQWDRDVFYRNFIIDDVYEVEQQFLSDGHILNNLRLDRQRDVRMFTDFELRNSDKYLEQSRHLPDIVMDFVLMPNGSHRVTTRDRRITLHGVTHPVSFYNPDYSQSALPLSEVKDYRRTLYWNPNARPDESGRFDAHFFNNSKQTSIRVSVAGLTDQGQPLVLE